MIIEQAKGVLAQQLGIEMDAAFERMRSHARSRGVRLTQVARRVVTGDLNLGPTIPG